MEIAKTKKALPLSYLSSFCLELSLLLKAGISLNDGLMILYEDKNDKESKNLFAGILKNIGENMAFHDALKADGRFPEYMVNMIEIGSITGKSEYILNKLASYYDNQERISNYIRGAVIYPFILFILMMAVIFFLIIKVLPLFNDVFSQLGSEFSSFAKILLSAGSFVKDNIVFIAALLLIIAAAVIFLCANERARKAFVKKFVNRIISNTRAALTISSARFAEALSICLSSGTDTEKSIEMASKLVSNPILIKKINTCKALLGEGASTYEAFEASGLFSNLNNRMLYVGIKTGNADTVMAEIARRLSDKAGDEINAVVNKIEPALVIIMSALAGAILLCVMLPLLNIISVIG